MRSALPHGQSISPLTELLRRLEERDRPEAARCYLYRSAGAVGLAAALAFHLAGLLGLEALCGLLLAGWGLSSAGAAALRPAAAGRPTAAFLAVRSLDALLLISAGLVCHLRLGQPPAVAALAVAAALTGYLAYYSGIAILKAVPGRVRLSHPALMIAADHLFLGRGSLWGAERRLTLGPASLGLALGLPAWGFAIAVVAGNLYWITRAWTFWRRAHGKES